MLGDVLLSRDPAVQVPSALEGLTVVFEMGTRGSPPPLSPNEYLFYQVSSEKAIPFLDYSLKTGCEVKRGGTLLPVCLLDKPSTD